MKTPAYRRRRSPAVESGFAIGSYRHGTGNPCVAQQTSLMVVAALASSIEKIENIGMTTTVLNRHSGAMRSIEHGISK
jgi:hypothetical protein